MPRSPSSKRRSAEPIVLPGRASHLDAAAHDDAYALKPAATRVIGQVRVPRPFLQTGRIAIAANWRQSAGTKAMASPRMPAPAPFVSSRAGRAIALH